MSVNSKRRVGFVFALVSAAALTAPAMAGATTGSLGSLGGGSLSGGSLGSAAEAPTAAPCSALSTGTTPAGWGNPFGDEKDYASIYVNDKVKDDDGSLKLLVQSITDRSASYHSAGSITLAEAAKSPISFSEKGATSIASFQLRLLGTEDGKWEDGFTTLVWEAGNNTGAVSTVDGGTHLNLDKGKWWSTSNIAGAKDRVPVTLDAIILANPKATVEHYGVAIGSGLAATTSTLVDGVEFNGCTTNFAEKDVETSTGSLGSLGFGSLFGSLGS